jgi:hypothetical protein
MRSDGLRPFSSRAAASWLAGAAAALAGGFWASPAHAIVNGEEVSAQVQSLDAVALLIGASEGAPACTGGVAGTCVLVEPDLVMTAAHTLLRPDGTPWPETERDFWVRFRRGESGAVSNSFPGTGCTGDFQERRIISITRVAGADMALCRLESAPVGIASLNVEYRREAIAGEQIIIAGWGFSGECIGEGDPWRLRWSGGTTAAGQQGTLLPINECALSPCVTCTRAGGGHMGDPSVQGWAVPNVHDSGAPVLIEVPCPDGGVEMRVLAIVMTSTYAVGVQVWHDRGGIPALTSVPSCAECIADHDADGQRTVPDVFAYIGDYMAGNSRADVDGAAGITVPDIFAFLTRWFAGCTG